ncbi:MAG TPA: VCBS repeat-containing protein [Puia sp.]
MRYLIIIIFLCCIYSCERYSRNQSHKEIPTDSVEAGELLAKKYCQGCHSLPEPSLLDIKSWENGVLPNMGPRLGIFSHHWMEYPSMRRDIHLPPNFYPAQPLLKPWEWQNIINFYLATAPDSLPAQNRSYPIKNDLDIFSASEPAVTKISPTTCFIQIDTTRSANSILTADIFRESVMRFDINLQPIDSLHFSGPVVDIDFHAGTMVATNIGNLNPNNAKLGKLQTMLLNPEGKMALDTPWPINLLQRPVQSVKIDLNGDGKLDELVCEFGHLTGALSWFENMGDNKYLRHVLRPIPGAIKAYAQDYNHDGLPDLFVLFAQGEEGIFLFTNRGHGQFDQKKILDFPPSYGSTYFEMDDFNHDGFPDIVYTCGDNADFSVVLKPYHGVYIFLNDGHWNFKQQYFFPINGCYKAMARDFDGDGDLDLAVISFFADYQKQPEEGFVYLENKGDFNFLPHSLRATQKGRWLTMDVGDLNKDGKPDILLGNFSIAPSFIKPKVDFRKGPAFLYLKNISTLPHSPH